eukprot:552269-Rhodomonas_salina.1
MLLEDSGELGRRGGREEVGEACRASGGVREDKGGDVEQHGGGKEGVDTEGNLLENGKGG